MSHTVVTSDTIVTDNNYRATYGAHRGMGNILLQHFTCVYLLTCWRVCKYLPSYVGIGTGVGINVGVCATGVGAFLFVRALVIL